MTTDRDHIRGLIAMYAIQTPAKEKELASLRKGMAEIESKLVLGLMPAAVGILAYSIFNQFALLLWIAIGLLIVSVFWCIFQLRTLQLEQRAKSKEIFFKEIDKGMEGELGDLDARLLNLPELKDDGVGAWMQSRLGARVSETAYALSKEFEGNLRELFHTSKVLEERD